MTQRFDPEYAEFRKAIGDQLPAPVFENVFQFRAANEMIMPAMWGQLPPQPTIQKTRYKVPSYDGAEIEIVRFADPSWDGRDKPQAAWLYFHGGGMVTDGVDFFAPLTAQYAQQSGVPVFSVEYRVAPEFPHPTPVEDAYAALRWLSAKSKELNVDSARIGLAGDSAGGGLAMGTTLKARNEGFSPPVGKVMLLCPMLDDRKMYTIPDDTLVARIATVPRHDMALCWEAYVGKDKAGGPDGAVSELAAPSRVKDMTGLPPTYIDVGNLDLFREECVEFAARLAAADVDVEFHIYSGLPHGFEGATKIPKTLKAFALRAEAMMLL